jgi:hypothetical protein
MVAMEVMGTTEVMVAMKVMVGASQAAAVHMAVTMGTTDMAVDGMAVGGEAIMVAMEEVRARVRVRVSPAVPVSVEVSAALAH